MIRLLPFIVLAMLMAAVIAWLADAPGLVSIDFPGYRIETPIFVAAALVMALLGAWIVVYRFWHWLRRGYPQRRAMARRERGYRELTDGLAALMAGEGVRAGRHARKSQKLLGPVPMAQLISGQAAQLTGDYAGARKDFEALSEDKRTNVLGLRGLVSLSEHEGDDGRALEAAREALTLYPKARWAHQKLFELATRAGAWEDAEIALSAAEKLGDVEAGDLGRRRAAILLQRANKAEAVGAEVEALRLARKALAQDATLVPARVFAARMLGDAGKTRRAEKLLREGWALGAHPSLVSAWDALAPELSDTARLKRVEKLVVSAPHVPEALYALACASLGADLPGPAKGHLETLIEHAPSARAYRLLGDVEDRLEAHDAAEIARAKAGAAPLDPSWSCSDCGHDADDWSAVCPSCEAFASFTWGSADTPGVVRRAAPVTDEPVTILSD